MNQYETVFILTPVLSEDQAREGIDKFRKILKDSGARIIHEESWGLRKGLKSNLLSDQHWMSFDKKSTGYYHLFEYQAEGVAVRDLEMAFKRDERVLRFMTVRLDQHA